MTDFKIAWAGIGFMLFCFVAGMAAAIWIPDRWERAGWREAIVIRICPKRVPVVRLPNGEVWVRLSWAVRYPVEDEKTVCPS
jgi:hypothetical protein